VAETPDGAQLCIERSFEYGENGILEIVGHGNLLSPG
jgi:hypothetical protein